MSVRYTRLTPPGEGGIGKILVWGAGTLQLLCSIFVGKRPLAEAGLYHGQLTYDGQLLDEVILRLPEGEPERVEVTAHGGEVPLSRIARALEAHGARVGEHEHCLRQSGLDRIRIEALRALRDARTALAVEIALAQVDGRLTEALRGPLDRDRVAHLREAAQLGCALFAPRRVVLIGSANVGKSSLFNRLAGQTISLVDENPATTRDWVTAAMDVKGVPIDLIDTAADSVGTREQTHKADRVLWLCEAEAAEPPEWLGGCHALRVSNKQDLEVPAGGGIPVSAATGEGVDRLAAELIADLDVQLTHGVDRAVPLCPAQWTLVDTLWGLIDSDSRPAELARVVDDYFDAQEW